jgi:biotin transport system ATP-binding protein
VAPRIALSGVGLILAGKAVLSDITLPLSEDRLGIIGRHGSGKGTLLRVMAGLVAPTADTVRLERV